MSAAGEIRTAVHVAEELIAEHGGDARAIVAALVGHVEYLEGRIDTLERHCISWGYVRAVGRKTNTPDTG